MDPSARDMGLAQALRVDYRGEGLSDESCPLAPWPVIDSWVTQAIARNAAHQDVPEPTSLAVATVDEEGMPDVRVVLMRFLDESGPAFLTNLRSAKGRQIAVNSAMAASLTWPSMFRSVRFRGYAQELPRDMVADYFRSRPYGSRISAHVSQQSQPIVDRVELERAWAECEQRWPDDGTPEAVPVPEFWGGYRLLPQWVEVWAGRSDRLHDRFGFRRTGPGSLADPHAWERVRLQP